MFIRAQGTFHWWLFDDVGARHTSTSMICSSSGGRLPPRLTPVFDGPDLVIPHSDFSPTIFFSNSPQNKILPTAHPRLGYVTQKGPLVDVVLLCCEWDVWMSFSWLVAPV